MKEIKKKGLYKFIEKLTRNEMRYVMAGSGSSGSGCYDSYYECGTNGACATNSLGKCYCHTQKGDYLSNSCVRP